MLHRDISISLSNSVSVTWRTGKQIRTFVRYTCHVFVCPEYINYHLLLKHYNINYECNTLLNKITQNNMTALQRKVILHNVLLWYCVTPNCGGNRVDRVAIRIIFVRWALY